MRIVTIRVTDETKSSEYATEDNPQPTIERIQKLIEDDEDLVEMVQFARTAEILEVEFKE